MQRTSVRTTIAEETDDYLFPAVLLGGEGPSKRDREGRADRPSEAEDAEAGVNEVDGADAIAGAGGATVVLGNEGRGRAALRDDMSEAMATMVVVDEVVGPEEGAASHAHCLLSLSAVEERNCLAVSQSLDHHLVHAA